MRRTASSLYPPPCVAHPDGIMYVLLVKLASTKVHITSVHIENSPSEGSVDAMPGEVRVVIQGIVPHMIDLLHDHVEHLE